MSKTQLNQPEAETKPRGRYYESAQLPDVTAIKQLKIRNEVAKLLNEAASSKPLMDKTEARLKEIRSRLAELATDLDVKGFKTPQIGFYYNGMRTRRTLSNTKLLEAGVSLETINACYVESDEFQDTSMSLFTPKP